MAPDRKTITPVTNDINEPNGIIGTPDGKVLYVADLAEQMTWAYDIRPDGQLTNKRPFCQLGSDGMTIDSDGNVYLTGKGVTVFDKTGKQIEHIVVPRGLDYKRGLWRQKPRPALHHRGQECLRPQDEGEGRALDKEPEHPLRGHVSKLQA